jgi:hypothetical protein
MQLSDLPEFAPKKDQVYPVVRLIEEGVEYRECPTYVGYIAGSDGSVWRGYLDEPRQLWRRATVRMNGRSLAVWVSTDTGQYHVRVAVLILDAWGAKKIKRYIGYHDGDPANCRPENVYYCDEQRRQRRRPHPLNDPGLVRRVRALHAAGDHEAYIARLFGVPAALVRDILHAGYPHKPSAPWGTTQYT